MSDNGSSGSFGSASHLQGVQIGYWRRQCAPRILAVLQATEGLPEKEIRKRLRDAFPFGTRSGYPYTTWLDEIKRQRGLKPTIGVRKPVQPETLEENGQERLFG